MITEAIDFRYLLLDNYKKLNITEDELVTILIIDHLIDQGNNFITADLLSLKMSFDINKLDSILADLMKKKLLDIDIIGSKTITTLNPLKEKLYAEFDFYRKQERIEKSSQQKQNELDNIYASFQKLLGRTLSPVEISKIREWVSYGYSDETIINALKDALNKGKKTLRAVDKILLSYQVRDDLENEGITPITDEWQHNLEETIKIVKTPWLKDEKK